MQPIPLVTLGPLIRGLVLGCLAACSPVSPPSPVRLEGEPPDIRRLVGTWQGEFLNNETARVGKIFLELRAESDTAFGKITFDRLVPITTCTDMSRPQAPSNVVVPVNASAGRVGNLGKKCRRLDPSPTAILISRAGWILGSRDA